VPSLSSEGHGIAVAVREALDDKFGRVQECDATITLTRVRLGTLDTAFHSGRISGEQTRRAIFHTKS